jgi:hypothetical protein
MGWSMTAFGSKTHMGGWKLAGTIAMAGVALVYREAVRMLDERAGRLLARAGSRPPPKTTAER